MNNSDNNSVETRSNQTQSNDKLSIVKIEKYNPICWRFPQLNKCGCTRPCRQAVPLAVMYEIIPNLYVGPIECAYNIHKLYESPYNIRAIVNCTTEKYTQVETMFRY